MLDNEEVLSLLDLDWDSSRQELFLRCAPPHHNICITLARKEDADALTKIMNEERVYSAMSSFTDSFSINEAADWLERLRATSLAWHDILFKGKRNEWHKLGGLPFEIIRIEETIIDDEKVQGLIGKIAVQALENLKSRPVRDATIAEPTARLPDSFTVSNATWRAGYFLDPDYNGRGIMTACLRRMLLFMQQVTKAADPSEPAPSIFASTWDPNPASAATLAKCGFKPVHRGLYPRHGVDMPFIRHQWLPPTIQNGLDE